MGRRRASRSWCGGAGSSSPLPVLLYLGAETAQRVVLGKVGAGHVLERLGLLRELGLLLKLRLLLRGRLDDLLQRLRVARDAGIRSQAFGVDVDGARDVQLVQHL